jgi:hypothetical protein
MTIREKIKLLNIVCVNSERNEFEFFYDFKLKDQLYKECIYTTHLRILTEQDLNQFEVGNILMNLKKLNTIEKKIFRSFPFSHRDLIFVENLETKYLSNKRGK